jgi:hypothetical protein
MSETFGPIFSTSVSGGGSGTVTSVSNVDGTIVITGTPTIAPIVSRAAITGDISIPAGSNTATLPNVNSNVGTFGDSTHVGQFTVNAKGQVTAASNVSIAVGTVTSVSVVSANGFAGSVANPTTTPAITISTSINAPILAGNGTALIAATTTGTGTTAVLSVSPAFTGTPTAPTASPGDNTTQIATDAFVTTAVANATAPINAELQYYASITYV